MQYVVFSLLIALVGGVHFYLAHHVWRWIHYFFPKFPLAIPLIFFLLMAGLMMLSVANPFEGGLRYGISAVGVCWMGVFVYLLMFCVLADLATLIPWLLQLPSPKLALFRAIAGICATAFSLSVCAYGFCHAQRLYTVEYDVQLSQAPTSEMNVVMLSDVHLGALGSESRLERIVEEINRLEPDLVCIAGDFFDTDFRSIQNPESAIETMKKIRSRYGVYACLGNHDAGKTLSSMIDFLEQANVTLLSDQYVVIDGCLILAGRLDIAPIGGTEGYMRGELTHVLEGADPNLPVVVLDHNPASADTYTGEVDLVLSGHTHKGQIFPGSLITGAMYTVDYGYYRADSGTQFIVTSGAGIWGLPMRVGTNCEIVNIHLKV